MIDDRNETKRGMLWLGSATVVTRLVDVGSSLVAMALLSREEMGTAALALSAGAIAESISGLGLGHALIQARNLTRDEEHSLFWLATLIGLGLAVILAASAPFVADVYKVPVLLPMIALTGVKLITLGSALVPHQLLSKNLKFREAGAAQALCTLGEATTKIALASLGFGAWSLVLANALRGPLLLGSVLWLSGFRPRAHFSWREVSGYQSFGLRIATSGLFYQGYRNADYFLIGKVLGVEALGVYRVAYEIGMQPLEVVLNLVNRVSYPIYAKVAHDVLALKGAFLRSTRSMTLLAAPIAAFLFFATSDLIPLVTHPRWTDAVPAVRILVWGALLKGVAHLFPQVYVAAGRPHYAAFDSAVSLVLLVTLFWSGLTLLPEWGTLSVCWAWVLAYPMLLQLNIVMTRRITPLTWPEYLRALTPGIGGALVMSVGMLATRPLELGTWGHLPSLIGTALVGITTYAAYLRIVLGVHLRDLAPKPATIATESTPTQVEAG